MQSQKSTHQSDTGACPRVVDGSFDFQWGGSGATVKSELTAGSFSRPHQPVLSHEVLRSDVARSFARVEASTRAREKTVRRCKAGETRLQSR